MSQTESLCLGAVMARDEVDPSLILTERRKRKVSSYVTNEDNGSADRADTVKRLRKTIESTEENQAYADDEQNEDGGTYHHEDDMDIDADSPRADDAGSDLSRNAKKNPSKTKKKKTTSRSARLGPGQKQSSRTLSSHDSDADSEEDEIEVIATREKPEEEPEEELGK